MLNDADKKKIKDWESKNLDHHGRYIGPDLMFFPIKPGQYVDYMRRGLRLVRQWHEAERMKDGAMVGDYLTVPNSLGGSFDIRVLELKETEKGRYYSGVIDSRVPVSYLQPSSDYHGRRWGAYESECQADPDGSAMKTLRPKMVAAIEWA